MKNFTQLERIILRDIIASQKGLEVYTFWRRHRISPAKLVKVLKKYNQKGIISFDGTKAEITKKGREWVVRKRIKLLIEGQKSWRECPEKFKQSMLTVNEPIAPNISIMANSMLPKQWRR